ncbi:UNVERIFIED_CONTAM: deoxyribonuclease [Mumia flava]
MSPSTPGADTALALLATLPVKGRAPKTGYDRDQFGQAWADVDRNGCDTRNDILRRDLTELVVESGTHGCVVLTGRLDGPYTGESIDFVRGAATSSAVQIDHVVALSDAWQKGGQQLRLGARTALANDPLNLLAVDGPTNASKGDGDAATWLPPSKHFRCAYVARQVAVKARYDLWVTRAEHDAIERVLTACPDTVVPTSEPVPLGGGRTGTPEPTSGPTPTRKPTRRGTGSTDPRFDTCTAAIDAGYGPYVRGKDAEYGWYDDRDADGTVCE